MKHHRKSLATLAGAGLATTLSVGAAANPFSIRELDHTAPTGLAEASPATTDSKTQSGNASDNMKGTGEMKCGARMMKDKTPDSKTPAGTDAKTESSSAAPAPQK